MLVNEVINKLLTKYGSNSSYIIIMRHYDYILKNVMKKYPDKTIFWILANHYSRSNLIPDWEFPLSRIGKECGWADGQYLKSAGVEINNFRCSRSMRAIESIVSIGETYSEDGIIFELDDRLMSERYNAEVAEKLLEEKFLVNRWFNGKHKYLVCGPEGDPEVYKKNRLSLIQEFLIPGQFSLFFTHLPEVLFFDQTYYKGLEIGSFEEDYEPPKGGGVLITKANGEIKGYRFQEKLIICN